MDRRTWQVTVHRIRKSQATEHAHVSPELQFLGAPNKALCSLQLRYQLLFNTFYQIQIICTFLGKNPWANVKRHRIWTFSELWCQVHMPKDTDLNNHAVSWLDNTPGWYQEDTALIFLLYFQVVSNQRLQVRMLNHQHLLDPPPHPSVYLCSSHFCSFSHMWPFQTYWNIVVIHSICFAESHILYFKFWNINLIFHISKGSTWWQSIKSQVHTLTPALRALWETHQGTKGQTESQSTSCGGSLKVKGVMWVRLL